MFARSASFSATQGFKWLVFVCVSVTDFSDLYGYRLHRGHPLFPLLSFQLGFSGIPENDEKTSKSYLREASRRTPFWDPFLSLFSEKDPFSPRRVRPLFASLRRNPARRVNLVNKSAVMITSQTQPSVYTGAKYIPNHLIEISQAKLNEWLSLLPCEVTCDRVVLLAPVPVRYTP